MSAKIKANAVCVTNTKLAAAMIALGFGYKAELIQPEKRGETLQTQFLFFGASQRPLFQHISLDCAHLWEKGVLEKKDPMHPLCIMMRTHENRDRLLDWQKQGLPHTLRSVKETNAQMLVYRQGDVRDFTVEHFTLEDLDLAVCLGGVGIPVTIIEGSDGAHVYTLPRFGYGRKDAKGVVMLEDGFELIKTAPTKEDPRRLLLEVINPMHPVAIGYDVLNVRAILKAEIETTEPLLLMQKAGTDRQALITLNSSGRVMEKVTKHFEAPRIDWGK